MVHTEPRTTHQSTLDFLKGVPPDRKERIRVLRTRPVKERVIVHSCRSVLVAKATTEGMLIVRKRLMVAEEFTFHLLHHLEGVPHPWIDTHHRNERVSLVNELALILAA